MIVILEGCDGGGKSTLALELDAKYGYGKSQFTKVHTTHHGPYVGVENPSIKYLSSMRRRQHGGVQNELVVLDRSWISEPIYGDVLRGGVDRVGTIGRRMLERLVLKAGGLVVICSPKFETVKKNWEKNKGRELIGKDTDLHKVYKKYFIVDTDLSVYYHDYEDSGSLEMLTGIIDRMNNTHRPPAAGIGNWKPESTLIVGESDGIVPELPFVNFHSKSQSYEITERLESEELQERHLYWADTATLSPDFMGREDAPQHVIAVDESGSEWCDAVGLSYGELENE